MARVFKRPISAASGMLGLIPWKLDSRSWTAEKIDQALSDMLDQDWHKAEDASGWKVLILLNGRFPRHQFNVVQRGSVDEGFEKQVWMIPQWPFDITKQRVDR